MCRGKSANQEFPQFLDAGLSYESIVSDGWLPWCWLDNIIPLLHSGLQSVQTFHLHDPIIGTSQYSEAKVQVRYFFRFWTQACHMSQLCLSDDLIPWFWFDKVKPLLHPGLHSVQAFHLHDPINGTSQCSEAKVQVRNFRRFWTQACHMSQLCLMDGSHGVGLTKLNLCCIQGYILS